MRNMPSRLVQPENKLTFAKISSYVIDQRDNRIQNESSQKSSNEQEEHSDLFEKMTNLFVLSIQFAGNIPYFVYIEE